MSDLNYLYKMLLQSFEDEKLSKQESKALRKVLTDIQTDENKNRFVMNRAFEIVRETIKDDESRRALKWLQDIVRVQDKVQFSGKPDVRVASSAFFSPGNEVRETIIARLSWAKESVDICVFTVTDNRITSAIKQAHQRGVKIRIITDDDKSMDRGSDIDELRRLGIPLVMDKTNAHMHHKFAIFDHTRLLSGSFNWTRSASTANHENILVTNDPTLVNLFKRQFNQIWKALNED